VLPCARWASARLLLRFGAAALLTLPVAEDAIKAAIGDWKGKKSGGSEGSEKKAV